MQEPQIGAWQHGRVPLGRVPLLTLVLAVALAGCSGEDRAATPALSPPAGAAAASPSGETVQVVVGQAAPVTAEVADTPEERAVGLMRRPSVPVGTGMVFLYDAPSTGRFYMYDVDVPLTAVFARDGEVVFVVDMPPCPEGTQPQDCPTYGPDEPFDTVLETAPVTLRGKVSLGDRLEVRR